MTGPGDCIYFGELVKIEECNRIRIKPLNISIALRCIKHTMDMLASGSQICLVRAVHFCLSVCVCVAGMAGYTTIQ